ncbi:MULTISPECIES: GNAT family N-acetyltransferase [unclassified Paludibacterium]|uniref:GNAT family N-acetyltransferase n=1 Tax=unclassified Paludibacterium TaxID=2618429 RepID=UPI001C05D36C|nr:GNAT family N-acetyltransferase [Paludibacterium sp. B53371]BEV70723.1 hypothetical protein THUN1379_02050 [Paludibacterium sp. THUN1379]
MDITLRLLQANDAEAFRALRLHSLHTDPLSFVPYPDEEASLSVAQFAQRLTEPPCVGMIGAFCDGQLVGMVGLLQHARRKQQHKLTIVSMYVAESARGSGTGRKLMQAAIAHARQQPGVSRLLLSVHGTNVPAIRLYRSLGFVPYGVEPEAMVVHGQPQDEILMGLAL